MTQMKEVGKGVKTAIIKYIPCIQEDRLKV